MGSVAIAGVLMTMVMVAASGARAEGAAASVEKLAIKYCSRCHVIGDYNRLGGIDSTPSFPVLARRDDFVERLQTFYQRRPHPVFVRVPGVPRWSKAHPFAAPFTVTYEQIDDLIAYVRTLRDKPRPRRRRRR